MSVAVPARVIPWAAYLATSWTWCIGMFLPVLLVRDIGLLGFCIFALPNLAGAAAMGWVLRRPGTSEAAVARHAPAMRAFSYATISFQAFFAAHALIAWGHAGVTAAALLGASLLAALWRGTAATYAMLMFIASLACLALLADGRLAWGHPMGDGMAALALTPAFAFGFMLCPYLDLTFHRARQRLPGAEGTAAFALGFGVLFPLMILGTLGYSGLLLRGQLPAVLAIHIGAQLAATMALHQFELRGTPIRTRCSIAAAAVAVGATGLVASGLVPFEHIYHAYLGLYGCAFPVYAWVCMIPHRRHADGPTRGKLVLCGIVAVVATGFLWASVVEGKTALALPGAAIMFAGRLALAFIPGRRT